MFFAIRENYPIMQHILPVHSIALNMKPRTFTSVILLSLALFMACKPSPKSTAEPKTSFPNIVLILADDMGYGDIQAYNPASTIATPNLNQLAQEGIMFTDAHTPSSVCTPTRYGLMTGRYAWRSRLKRGVLSGYSPHLIEPDRQTIGHLLQTKGYQTAVVGKWHLGLDWAWDEAGFPEEANRLLYVPKSNAIDYSKAVAVGPQQNGFSYSYVVPGSLDMGPYVYLENNQVKALPDSMYPGSPFPAYIRKGETGEGFDFDKVLQHLTDRASNFIQEQAQTEQPFFLYMPLTGPHKPALPNPAFAGKSDLGPYADLVMEVDATVGRIMKTLKASGVEDNTLFIYTSDNGSYMYRYAEGESDHVSDSTRQGYLASHHTANKNWRGTKADIWEAGHHVPFILRYPGQAKAGSKQSQSICLTDVLASLCELTGQSYDPAQAEDSYSFLPLLKSEPVERPSIVHHSVGGMFALRKGKWKLIFGDGSGGREKPRGELWGKPYQLFDLEADPGERTDLASEASSEAIMTEMTAELEEILTQTEGHGVDLSAL